MILHISDVGTEYGYWEFDIDTYKGVFPISDDISILGEAIEYEYGNEKVRLFVPENAPLGPVEFFYKVGDNYGNYVDASQTINIVSEFVERYGDTKLFKDVNSGELLFADSSNESEKILLINKDSSSYVSSTNQIAVDIEQDLMMAPSNFSLL